mmetsp:Transcript_24604/g.44619  ORF Transcript_24604/g.44619 Transcript_24604/m.44619 type:complete len:372 (+) Transcript_24604:2094-3209(+)
MDRRSDGCVCAPGVGQERVQRRGGREHVHRRAADRRHREQSGLRRGGHRRRRRYRHRQPPGGADEHLGDLLQPAAECGEHNALDRRQVQIRLHPAERRHPVSLPHGGRVRHGDSRPDAPLDPGCLLASAIDPQWWVDIPEFNDDAAAHDVSQRDVRHAGPAIVPGEPHHRHPHQCPGGRPGEWVRGPHRPRQVGHVHNRPDGDHERGGPERPRRGPGGGPVLPLLHSGGVRLVPAGDRRLPRRGHHARLGAVQRRPVLRAVRAALRPGVRHAPHRHARDDRGRREERRDPQQQWQPQHGLLLHPRSEDHGAACGRCAAEGLRDVPTDVIPLRGDGDEAGSVGGVAAPRHGQADVCKAGGGLPDSKAGASRG